MTTTAQNFRIDVTELDLIGEASRESAFQSATWVDIKFWTSDLIQRNVADLKDLPEENDDLFSDQSPHWLTRANIFNENERKVIEFPRVAETWPRGYTSVHTLEEWDCVVTDISDDIVYSDAKPQIEQRGTKVVLEIPTSEFSKHDRVNLLPGLMFRYIICWSKRESGTLSREAFAYVRKVQRRVISEEEKSKLDLALSMLEFDGD